MLIKWPFYLQEPPLASLPNSNAFTDDDNPPEVDNTVKSRVKRSKGTGKSWCSFCDKTELKILLALSYKQKPQRLDNSILAGYLFLYKIASFGAIKLSGYGKIRALRDKWS